MTACDSEFTKSFKVLKVEQESLSDGVNAQPPEPSETTTCLDAVDTIDAKMKELRKALHDARLAWDEYRKNGNQSPLALCDRTRAVFGNVESGCTVASARRWIQQYEDLARDLQSYYTGAFQTETEPPAASCAAK